MYFVEHERSHVYSAQSIPSSRTLCLYNIIIISYYPETHYSKTSSKVNHILNMSPIRSHVNNPEGTKPKADGKGAHKAPRRHHQYGSAIVEPYPAPVRGERTTPVPTGEPERPAALAPTKREGSSALTMHHFHHVLPFALPYALPHPVHNRESPVASVTGRFNSQQVQQAPERDDGGPAGSMATVKTDQEVHECKICKIEFGRSYEKQRHDDTKHGNTNLKFRCSYPKDGKTCGAKLGRSDAMIRHLKSVHGLNVKKKGAPELEEAYKQFVQQVDSTE